MSAKTTAPATSPWAPPTPIDPGTAGASANREAERLQARNDRSRRRSDDTQRASEWTARRAGNYAKGAEGERRVGAMLDSLTESGAIVLHDRRVPITRGNIDHLVVAASGVWIVEAKNWEGRVERRRGVHLSQRLYVDGHNRTDAVDNLGWQIQAVRAALTPIGFAEAPVTGVLCFTGATWGPFARPLRFGGALVTWPDRLIAEIADGPPTDPALINLVAQQLSSQLTAIR
jgi:hypothetical protein